MKIIPLFIALLLLSGNLIAEEEIENLILLKKGTSSSFAWCLYQAPSKDEDLDLILIIKNTGAKHIDLEGVDASYFTFTSSTGKKLKIWYTTGLDGISYRSIVVCLLHIQGPFSDKETYSLDLKKKKDAFVPISFEATGLKLKVSNKKKEEKSSNK